MSLRHLVAWAGHLPGLWLVYREGIPLHLRAPNKVAVALTFLSMGVAALMPLAAELSRTWAVFAAWLLGHIAWGSYLAYHLDDQLPAAEDD